MNPIARTAMRLTNAGHNWIFRKSSGRRANTVKGRPVLLLTVAGRRTGKPHTVPCVYLEDGGGWLVCGSANGMPEEPQWFRNLRATDRAEVELEGVRSTVAVRVLAGAERDAAWGRLLAAAPFFQGYQDKTDRQMPLATLTPRTS